MLLFAVLQQRFFMLARCGCLEGRHHAEPEIDQIILAAKKLVRDEGGGMDVAVIGFSPLYLKHFRFEHTARVVTDTGHTQIKR